MLGSLLCCLVALRFLFFFYRLGKRVFGRSPLANLPGPPSSSFIQGVFPQVWALDGWDFNCTIATEYGGFTRIRAMFGETQIYVFDPTALSFIFSKAQESFEESPQFLITNYLAFGEGLLGTIGEVHSRQKKMLNPSFSSASLKSMLPTFYEVADKMLDGINASLARGKEVDMLFWMNRFALEVIGQCGLGHSFDDLRDEFTPHPYSLSSKRLPAALSENYLVREYLLPPAFKIGTPGFRRFVLDMIPKKSFHELRDIADVLQETSVQIYEARKKSIQAGPEAIAKQVGHGKDILTTLMLENKTKPSEDRLSEKEILGQMTGLTFAATDTTSSLLSRILHLMALHPDAQERLRKEIRQAKEEQGELSYEKLTALPFLDAVIRETLRMYPPIALTNRVTKEDVVIPLSKPILGLDGQVMHEVFVPRDTTLIIGIWANNTNTDIWGADAFEWIPERWLKPIPKGVTDAKIPGVYSHLMSFVGGSRACIGFRFALLEAKVVLTRVLESYHISLSDKGIFWQLAGIVGPVVVGEKLQKLPLNLTRL